MKSWPDYSGEQTNKATRNSRWSTDMRSCLITSFYIAHWKEQWPLHNRENNCLTHSYQLFKQIWKQRCKLIYQNQYVYGLICVLCAFDLYILVPLSLNYTVHVHWLRKGGPDGVRSWLRYWVLWGLYSMSKG